MNRKYAFTALLLLSFSLPVFSQAADFAVRILKAEDERRYDGVLEKLLKNPNPAIRARAALAAGRIGDERAVAGLSMLLENGDENVRSVAAFAIGEIESIKADETVIKSLNDPKTPNSVRAKLVEAAGKVAAANAKDEKSKLLGKAILDTLEAENVKGVKQNRNVVLMAITAALRARPEGTDVAVAKFLTNPDARVRADAANTLSRVRAKNANEALRSMLTGDADAVARANAARALGAAEDKEAFNILLEAAAADKDSRVRVSAIRSLAQLKNSAAALRLIIRGEKLISDFKASKSESPVEKSELIEIVTALGTILPNSDNLAATKLLTEFRNTDRYRSPETEIALARISPKTYLAWEPFNEPESGGFILSMPNFRIPMSFPDGLGGFAQALSEIVENKSGKIDTKTIETAKNKIRFLFSATTTAGVLTNPELMKSELESAREKITNEISRLPDDKNEAAKAKLTEFDNVIIEASNTTQKFIKAYPEILRALSKAKPERYQKDIAELLTEIDIAIIPGKDGKPAVLLFRTLHLERKEFQNLRFFNKDVIVRATAAELVGEMSDLFSADLLSEAYDYAAANDRELNDAQLAILDALPKQKGPIVIKVLAKALSSPDHLVRKKASDLIKANNLQNEIPNSDGVDFVKPYDTKFTTKLGQILNTDADYKRAASRKNGSVNAVLTTGKGTFTIDLLPEDAPLTVDNFIKLAKSGYFNGLEVHRVVANFVMQDGDPRGDGNGGPGWSIRCELNTVPFERGAVGMALSGKDTGGSQWFVTHSPQPHLDGGYTVFGRVNETGMKIVDNIVRGDKIISVKIVEGGLPQRTQRARRQK